MTDAVYVSLLGHVATKGKCVSNELYILKTVDMLKSYSVVQTLRFLHKEITLKNIKEKY